MSNVSSVKNLNGEVFSAIQDASLTDLVNGYGVSINDVSSTVKTYSGQWGGGGSVDTIPVAVISPLVTGFSGESAYLGIESTALNLSSYVPVSSIGYNGTYISTISGRTISSYTGRYAMTANYANTAGRAYQDRNYNEITSYYQPKLSIAGDAGTITAINGSAVGASIPEGWELVAGAGIDIVDDAENNQTIISATGGGTTYTGVAPIIVTGNTISADSFDLTIGSGLAFENNTLYVSAQGGNAEVESYVINNSAQIDDTVTSYQTNSGDYLKESELGYNAVDEVSAINGSAIAQYGAEKQWLVHDDTLVHASNSAQYALGCNISALQRLMGIDETVLWEGSAPLDQSCLVNGTRETATLSEPLSSFNKIRIYAVWNTYLGNFEGCSTFEYPGTNIKGGYIMNDCTNQGFIAGGIWSANGTTFKLIKHWQAQYPGVKDASTNYGGIFKVIGIGRKQ